MRFLFSVESKKQMKPEQTYIYKEPSDSCQMGEGLKGWVKMWRDLIQIGSYEIVMKI